MSGRGIAASDDQIRSVVPVGRRGTVEDIASAVCLPRVGRGRLRQRPRTGSRRRLARPPPGGDKGPSASLAPLAAMPRRARSFVGTGDHRLRGPNAAPSLPGCRKYARVRPAGAASHLTPLTTRRAVATSRPARTSGSFLVDGGCFASGEERSGGVGGTSSGGVGGSRALGRVVWEAARRLRAWIPPPGSFTSCEAPPRGCIFLFSRPRSLWIIPSAEAGGAGQGPPQLTNEGGSGNGEKEGGVRRLRDQLQGLQRHARGRSWATSPSAPRR